MTLVERWDRGLAEFVAGVESVDIDFVVLDSDPLIGVAHFQSVEDVWVQAVGILLLCQVEAVELDVLEWVRRYVGT